MEHEIISCAGETFSLRNLVQTVPAQDTLQQVFEVLAQLAFEVRTNSTNIADLQHKFERVPKLEVAVQLLDTRLNLTKGKVETCEEAVKTHSKRIAKAETTIRDRETSFQNMQLALKDFATTKTVLKADVQTMKENLSASMIIVDTLNQDHKILSQSSHSGISDLRHQCDQLRYDLQQYEAKLMPTIQDRVDSAMTFWEQKMGGLCAGCKKLTIVVEEMNEIARWTHEKAQNLDKRMVASEEVMGETMSLREEIQLIHKNWMWSFAQEHRNMNKVQNEFERKLESVQGNPYRSYYGGVDGVDANSGAGNAAVVSGLKPNSSLVPAPHPHDTPTMRDQRARADTLGQAPFLRFAEVVRKLDAHAKELERLETTKADARSVWAEFRNRPDMDDVTRAVDGRMPAVEQVAINAASNHVKEMMEEKDKDLKELAERVDNIAERVQVTVDQSELDSKMEEWAMLVRATVRADDNCQWCRRPLLARAPGEKTCTCQMRDRSNSRAPSDSSLYGTNNVPYRASQSALPGPPSSAPRPGTTVVRKRPKTVAGMNSVMAVTSPKASTGPNGSGGNGMSHSAGSQRAQAISGRVIDPLNQGVVMSVQYMTFAEGH